MTSFARFLKKLAKAVIFNKKRLHQNIASQQADAVDVKRLLLEYTPEELGRRAERYYEQLEHWDYHLAVPFSSPATLPETLSAFASLTSGLRIVPDLSVLDFAAGSCWASHFLNQMGCEVFSLDVSQTALKIGKALKERHPVFGPQPPHEFLPFDGRTIDLPDRRVDRIICMDAFHHIPNQAEVLREMCRVLRDDGIAGFSEPGPTHSASAQAQYEMKHHHVLENDVVIEEIFALAETVGFSECRVAMYHPFPLLTSEKAFSSFLQTPGFVGPDDPSLEYLKHTVAYMANRRMFFLFKEAAASRDSRERDGLIAELHSTLAASAYQEGEIIEMDVSVRNSSEKIWLPATARIGAVFLGVHLLAPDGMMREFVYHKVRLTTDDRPVLPGETLQLHVNMPAPSGKGRYVLEVDLVSEGVTWFAINDSVTTRHLIEIR